MSVTHTTAKAKRAALNLSHEQTIAVEMACDLTEQIVGITGGAGTGKTTILKEIHDALADQHEVVLAAPTGRAARRIQEATGIRAKTVHKLLEFPQPLDVDFGEHDPNEPKRNKSNPITERVVLVDESSMVGPTLFRQLMDALPRNGAIRFIGDNNQLSPVEAGKAPFIDILERRPSIELTFNYRSGDALIANGLRILEGRIPNRNEKFEIIYTDHPVRTMLEWVTPEFTQPDRQIIVPTRNGQNGSLIINPSLQLRFNPRGEYLRLDRFDKDLAPLLVRKRDKFLWIKNDYTINLYNGETGIVDDLDTEYGSLDLTTLDRNIHVPPRAKYYNAYAKMQLNYDPRKALELGYAVTTHKAQGSEFTEVVYCICRAHAWMLNKRNFYTAITRARERVIVITDRAAMSYSVRKERPKS